MPRYRRSFVPGGTYFFTVKTERNVTIFNNGAVVGMLGDVLREARQRWPFEIPALVLLPDHLHSIWTLPAGNDAYSMRWGWIKKTFTARFLATGGAEQVTTESRRRNRRRGVWQRRFWEHTVKDEQDFEAYFDYIHWNPVKHGYVNCLADWPHSSFHRWVKRGVYPAHWGCSVQPPRVTSIGEAGE
ncbi:transposase [bacterium]|nr:transposase [bacterium]